MKDAEYAAWIEFYNLHPFDDMHRYHRPAALIATSLAGGGIQERLDFLAPDRSTQGLTDADVKTMRAFGFNRREG